MKQRVLSVACALCLFGAGTAAGQEAVGPVVPKPTQTRRGPPVPTIESYEKALDGLIKSGAPDRLAKQMSPAEVRALMERLAAFREHIAGIGVGPVTPKPLPVGPTPPPATPGPVTPGPVTPAPSPKPGPPSPKDATDSFKGLHQVLQGTAKTNPRYDLSAEDSRELRQLIDALQKYKAS